MINIFIIKKHNCAFDVNWDSFVTEQLNKLQDGERIQISGLIKKANRAPITILGVVPESIKQKKHGQVRVLKNKRRKALAQRRLSLSV